MNNFFFLLLLTLLCACHTSITVTEVSKGAAALPPTNNTLPVADNDSLAVLHNIVLPISLSATDPDGDLLTYSVLTGPSHGTILGSGENITYVPDAGYLGPDSFTYQVNDGSGDSNIATISISVVAIEEEFNDALFSGVTGIALARDSSSFVVSSTTEDNGIIRWIVKHYSGPDFSVVRTLEDTDLPHPDANGGGGVTSLDISPDGTTVVAGGVFIKDGKNNWLVKTYSGTNFQDIHIIDSKSLTTISHVHKVALAPDKSFIVAVGIDMNIGARWNVKRYSGPGFSVKEDFDTAHPTASDLISQSLTVDIAGDSSSFIVGGMRINSGFDDEGIVVRYSGPDFMTKETIFSLAESVVYDLAQSDDGRIIAVAQSVKDASQVYGFLVTRLNDPDGDGVYNSTTLDTSTDGFQAQTDRIDITPDGSAIIAAITVEDSDSQKAVIKSYTGPNNGIITTLHTLDSGNEAEVFGVKISSDGTWYLSGFMFGDSNIETKGLVKSGVVTP